MNFDFGIICGTSPLFQCLRLLIGIISNPRLGYLLFASPILIWLVSERNSKRSGKKLPPGPKGFPVFGSYFNLPDSDHGKVFKDWSHQYDSDIIHVNLAGTPMIILNSRESVRELLERRSSKYSDRPSYTMIRDLMGFDWEFSFLRYGKEWRDRRKLFTQEFQPPKSLRYRSQTLRAVYGLLENLLQSPEGFMKHLRHMAGSVILPMGYGIEVKSNNDPFVTLAEEALAPQAYAAFHGYYLVDCMPILRYIPSWFPGMKFKRQAKKWHMLANTMYDVPFAKLKQSMLKDKSQESVGSIILQHSSDGTEAENVLRSALASMYNAGADTSVSAMGSFMLAMTQNKHVQLKAQEAIDAVTGPNRLPDFGDISSIPYVDAILKEVLRWRPVAPLAFPHRLEVDDVYNEYFLPAGSVVYGNTWALLHDEEIYGLDVYTFQPERFLKDGQLDPDIPHPDAAFGFGRRVCPGQDIAWSSMWMTLASVLACFDISKELDAAGNEIEPIEVYSSGAVIYPMPFECKITVRNQEKLKLIKESFDHT